MSWQQLLDIVHEAADQLREENTRLPVACPNDGEPLITGPDGKLFCKFDGFTWPDDGGTR